MADRERGTTRARPGCKSRLCPDLRSDLDHGFFKSCWEDEQAGELRRSSLTGKSSCG